MYVVGPGSLFMVSPSRLLTLRYRYDGQGQWSINDRTYTDPYQLYNNDVFDIFHGLQSLCTALYHWCMLIRPTLQSRFSIRYLDRRFSLVWTWRSFSQYARLTGTQSMPPPWSLGFHRSRWNYISPDGPEEIRRGRYSCRRVQAWYRIYRRPQIFNVEGEWFPRSSLMMSLPLDERLTFPLSNDDLPRWHIFD